MHTHSRTAAPRGRKTISGASGGGGIPYDPRSTSFGKTDRDLYAAHTPLAYRGESEMKSMKSSDLKSVDVKSADMQNVIDSLEAEFSLLNLEYRKLLTDVQTPGGSTAESVQAQAEDIVSVIQQLHRKGEQLRTLKFSP